MASPEDKFTNIQERDEVGYYGKTKEDGSREKLYGIVLQTLVPTKLPVASGKFPGLPVTIELADVYERSCIIYSRIGRVNDITRRSCHKIVYVL